MPCVASDGSLTPVAAQVLGALAAIGGPAAADVIARATSLPLYRARATLRELQQEQLVDDAEGRHTLSAAGRARLAAAQANTTSIAPS